MFDEPIKIGLIRFADLYDHQTIRSGARKRNNKDRQYRHNSEQMEEVGSSIKRDELEFDSSHQPILVIYTTTANMSQQ